MATRDVSVIIRLVDHASAIAKKIAASLDDIANSAKKSGTTGSSGLKALALAAKGASAGIAGLAIGFKGLFSIVRGVFNFLTSFKTLLVGLVIGATTRKILEYADAWQVVTNRLSAFIDDAEEVRRVQNSLFSISQRSRTSIEDTARVYQRLLIIQDDLARSDAELLSFTESLNKAVIVSGATADEAAAALLQFSQGLASGTLRGDELRSVLEQLPYVAKIIAKQLGVTIGELRRLGFEGKITANQIFDAFKAAKSEIDEQFRRRVVTVAEGFTLLRNSMTRAVGTILNSTGVYRGLTSELKSVSEFIDNVTRITESWNTQLDYVTVTLGTELPKTIETAADKIKDIIEVPLGIEIKDQTGTVGEYFINFIKTRLAAILPFVADLIGNAIVAAISQGIVFLATLLPVFIKLAIGVAEAFAVALLNALRQSAPILKRLLGETTGQDEGLPARLQGGIVEAATSARNSAIDRIVVSASRIYDNYKRIKEEAKEIVGVIGEWEESQGLTNEKLKVTADQVNPAWQGFRNGLEGVTSQLDEVGELGAAIGNVVGQAFLNLGAAIAQAIVYGENFGEAMKQVFAQMLVQIAQLIIQFLILKAVAAAFGFASGGQVPGAGTGTGIPPAGPEFPGNGLYDLGFAGGGEVHGPPPPSPRVDNIPAMLQAGEFVMNRAAVAKYGSRFMAALNARAIPPDAAYSAARYSPARMHFADGGQAGRAAPASVVLPAVVATEDNFAKIVNGGTNSMLDWMRRHSSEARAALGVARG